MLAKVKVVKQFVNSVGDLKSDGWNRRVWNNKSKVAGKRNLAFRFWGRAEADAIAEQLKLMLFAAGYDNAVTRTDVGSSYERRSSGGNYVRVEALAD